MGKYNWGRRIQSQNIWEYLDKGFSSFLLRMRTAYLLLIKEVLPRGLQEGYQISSPLSLWWYGLVKLFSSNQHLLCSYQARRQNCSRLFGSGSLVSLFTAWFLYFIGTCLWLSICFSWLVIQYAVMVHFYWVFFFWVRSFPFFCWLFLFHLCWDCLPFIKVIHFLIIKSRQKKKTVIWKYIILIKSFDRSHMKIQRK